MPADLVPAHLMRADLMPELYPPATYSAIWVSVGVGLLVAVVAFVVIVVLATRPGGLHLPRPARRSTRVRRAALLRIDRIDAAHRAGEMDAPTASSELSQAVRVFAAQWSGRLYPAMTLRDLRAGGADDALRVAVTRLYDGAFTPAGADQDVSAAAAMAREVVTQWNRS